VKFIDKLLFEYGLNGREYCGLRELNEYALRNRLKSVSQKKD